MQIQMVMVPTHFCLNHFFMYKFDMGLRGIAIASNFTFCMCLILIFIRMKFLGEIEFTLPVMKDVLFDIKTFIFLAFSGLLLTCLEEWCNNALSMFAGFIGVKE